MRNTCSFQFYCRASKMNKNGLSPIEVSLSVNGKRNFFNLPIKCSPIDFNKKRRPHNIDKYLITMTNNINEYIIQLAEEGIPLTVNNLHNAIRTGGVRTYTIEELFKSYEKILEQRIDIDMCLEHYRKYTLTRDMFFQVVDKNREASSITNEDILTFRNYIATKLSPSTQSGYMSRLKAYMRFAINNNKLHTNPFEGIKIKKVTKPVETITKDELNRIINKDFGNKRLNNVKELFLLSCGSGLSYADIIQLEPSDFIRKENKVCIFKERQKTGVKFYSVLMPFAVDILNKHNGDISSLKLSNQKLNSYLKEIADLCNITTVDSLHFHLARHYYATNAINSGVPLEIVQKLVGHSKITQTQHYAKLMEDTIIREIDKIEL